MASRGYLWVGMSVGTILVYQIPHLNGLPLVSGKPFLASDGHTGPVQVLLRIKTKLDISTARFDQFVSDEERMNAQATLPQSGHAPAMALPPESREECLDPHSSAQEPQSRYSPTPVDETRPPPVRQIIQQLEARKGDIVHPKNPHLVIAKPTPSTQPDQDVKERAAAENDQMVEEEGRGGGRGGGGGGEGEGGGEEGEGGGYEDARLILDAHPQMELTDDDDPRYDKVPMEDLDLLLYDGGVQPPRPRLESEVQIDPSRYEVSQTVMESGYSGLYTLGNEDPLEQSMQVSNQMEGSVFVLTGGTGLVSFRQRESASLSPLIQPQAQNIALSRQDIMSNMPCVLTYQIPNV